MFFPLGIRLSTWVAIAAFLLVALIRRDSRPVLAGWVWMFGFEAAYQACALPLHSEGRALYVNGYILIVVGAFTVAWFSFHGVLPDWRWMLLVAALWVVWLAIGFPSNNHTLVHFNVAGEILNEGAKSAWALAYLWPLIRLGRLNERRVEALGASRVDAAS